MIENSLVGEHIVLEPLRQAHAPALSIAVCDGELWKLWFAKVPHPDLMNDYIAQALLDEQNGESLAFAVRDRHSGEIVGSTRIYHWQQAHRRLKIGYTWYAKSTQRTGVNSECKLLLLKYAFETLDVIAVAFETHIDNNASRNAIVRLGAKQDGILRHHQLLADGTIRDTVVYSILNTEWPEVKRHLTNGLVNNT
ncbi:GNAT family N-acetyltransferase [Shewanella sp.]|nr:GNAT family N-acetyltransferase [Shewanella sp.]